MRNSCILITLILLILIVWLNGFVFNIRYLMFRFHVQNNVNGKPKIDSHGYNVKEVDNDVNLKSKNRESYNLNNRPIIGILAQELSHLLVPWYGDNYTSYISAAYVKYIEQAGARVAPVLINQDEKYYEKIFSSINGFVMPGGAASFRYSGYAKAGKCLFDKAINSDSYWPIWGTCLGFRVLAYLSNEEQRSFSECSSHQQPLALNLTEGYWTSHFGKQIPNDITEILYTQKVALNSHGWCLTPENFTKFEALRSFWNVLATNRDFDGVEFISLMEAKHYPMWVSQYHPEKVSYEWALKHPKIPHFKDAIHAAAHQAEFFVEEARKNLNSFANREEEERYLIYRYHPKFTGRKEIDYAVQQSYLF